MPGIARTIEAMLDALGYDRVDVLGRVARRGRRPAACPPGAPAGAAAGARRHRPGGLGGVPGSPRVLLALATPRRYHQPDYYRRIAGRIYGGQARRDPDALLHGSLARFVQRPSAARLPRPALRDQPAGPACRGCAGSGSRPSCWPATTTRSSRWSTDASSPAAFPTPALHVVPRRRPPVPPRAAGGDGSAGHRVPGGATVNGTVGVTVSLARPHQAVGLTRLRRLRALQSAAGPIGWPNRSPELGAVTVAQREIGSLPNECVGPERQIRSLGGRKASVVLERQRRLEGVVVKVGPGSAR